MIILEDVKVSEITIINMQTLHDSTYMRYLK
jgi:hypothetical protein